MPRFIASKCWANPLCVYILPFCFTCAWLSFQTWAFLCHAVETQYRFTCIIFLNALRTKNYIAFVEHVSCLINDRHKLLPSINLPAARVNDGKVGSLKKKTKTDHSMIWARQMRKKKNSAGSFIALVEGRKMGWVSTGLLGIAFSCFVSCDQHSYSLKLDLSPFSRGGNWGLGK